MTKKTEFIPFMGAVEIDDEEDEVQERNSRELYEKSLREVADELGVSRETVGQAEKRGLRKAKELLLKKFKKSDLI